MKKKKKKDFQLFTLVCSLCKVLQGDVHFFDLPHDHVARFKEANSEYCSTLCGSLLFATACLSTIQYNIDAIFKKLIRFSPHLVSDDFTLDPNTAMIRTRKNLERQQTFSYTLTIGVSDQGKPSRVSMVKQINVKNYKCRLLSLVS